MSTSRQLWAQTCCALFFLLVSVACGTAPSQPDIRFKDVDPGSAVSYSPNDTKPLRVAVAAVISPKGTVESYSDLLAYLGRKLNRRVELVQRQTYAEVNDLVKNGEVDVAFVCTSAYVVGQRDFGMELLVAPQVNGETVYYSLLIVPSDSPARSMADLRGKVFAFTDPISLTGRVYPTSLVRSLDGSPDAYFARVFFTYSHDNAIKAVADKVADGANVDSLVYDYLMARDPTIAARTRVIHRSPAFGIPPVVVNPNFSPQLKETLRELFLQMNADPEGQVILRSLMIDRFVVASDRIYDSARALELQVNTAP
ncbi:MAG: phosphate/phosphite/phosphonate ABC transporter substrate-binding protein [Chloroflexi bacterium]|nr:phosphate/phosphite/phosphonate ABC transporter substrate-binding protein [Chloroflexota bacterium]MCL5952691.1 phosphate/phosphite/phosphonate ABC transporter substrate-binding protein [Chloroflexota bacterium]